MIFGASSGNGGIAHSIGELFHPIFVLFSWVLAFFYSLVPNYALAIALLTLLVMAVTSPLLLKSMRGMAAMQLLQPEMMKLRAKYKDDKVTFQEELMKLYRENGASPTGGCLPMVIQFPFFIGLYDVIRGLTHTSINPVSKVVTATPLYINHHTRLYQSLRGHPGHMKAFGVDLAKSFLTHGIFSSASYAHLGLSSVPYALMVVISMTMQYFQMHQMNKRNPAANINPQMQSMQRIMPIFMGFIYLNIAAGVNVYFIISSAWRIGIQTWAYESGYIERATSAKPGDRKRSLWDRLAEAQQQALEQKAQLAESRKAQLVEMRELAGSSGSSRNGDGTSTAGSSGSKGGTASSAKVAKAHAGAGGSQKRNADGLGTRPPSSSRSGSGSNPASTTKSVGPTESGPDSNRANGTSDGSLNRAHPRSKSKKARKSR